jgi:hypothetical protein
MLTVSPITENAEHLQTLLHQAPAHPSIDSARGFLGKWLELLTGFDLGLDRLPLVILGRDTPYADQGDGPARQ